MDLRYLLAKEIADGIITTGIEGGFDSVTCSTAGNYPSLGVSQWEGRRCNNLLSMICGGQKFMARRYSDIVEAGELWELRELLASPEGQEAQRKLLASDCLNYADAIMPLTSDSKCVIYAGMWCPTSTNVVRVFVRNRRDWGYDVGNLAAMRDVFRDQYYKAADVGDMYRNGYANRAEITYQYLVNHDIDWSVLDV